MTKRHLHPAALMGLLLAATGCEPPSPGLHPAGAAPVSPTRQKARELLARLEGNSPGASTVAQSLADLGPEVIPELTGTLGTGGPLERAVAATALGMVGPEARRAVPELVRLLEFRTCDVRVISAETLGRIGPAAAKAVPSLARTAGTDKSPDVRMCALRALTRIQPVALPVRVALAQALGDPSAEVRRAAAGILAPMGPLAENAAPALARALGDGDPEVRRLSARALALIGPPGVPHLLGAMKAGTADARAAAGNALKAMKRDKAVPGLMAILTDEGSGLRTDAADALVALGADAVAALAETVAGGKGEARRLAVYAWGRIGPSAEAGVPALIGALKGADKRTRVDVIDALGRIGPAAKAAIPALRQAAKDDDTRVRLEAAAALSKIEGK